MTVAQENYRDVMMARGKIITYAIGAFIIFGVVVTLFANFGPWSLTTAIINAGLVAALMKGTAWVRYLFIVVLAFGAANMFMALGSVTVYERPHAQDTPPAVQAQFNPETREFEAVEATEMREGFVLPPREAQTGFAYAFFSVLFGLYVIATLVLTFNTAVKIYFLSRSVGKFERLIEQMSAGTPL
jgi:hypothetical protein